MYDGAPRLWHLAVRGGGVFDAKTYNDLYPAGGKICAAAKASPTSARYAVAIFGIVRGRGNPLLLGRCYRTPVNTGPVEYSRKHDSKFSAPASPYKRQALAVPWDDVPCDKYQLLPESEVISMVSHLTRLDIL